MKTVRLSLLVFVAALALAGCTAGANDLARTASAQGVVAGFWLGLWHGVIAPVTLIISWFSHTVRIYEVHNNGGWYDFGFLLGMSCTLGGGASGRAMRRRNRTPQVQ